MRSPRDRQYFPLLSRCTRPGRRSARVGDRIVAARPGEIRMKKIGFGDFVSVLATPGVIAGEAEGFS